MGCGTSNRDGASEPKLQKFMTKDDTVEHRRESFNANYELDKKLGNGTYSEVWTCKMKKTGILRAVKIIKKSRARNDTKLMDMLKSEIQTLTKVDSPSIMKIYELYEDQYRFYIVLEAMLGPDLLQYITKTPQREFTERMIAGILRQALVGLNHCHSLGIVHRDVKPNNLIFADSECKQLKLIDFGFAKVFDPSDRQYKELLGSPLYIAPEVCHLKPYGSKSDIWSLGIISYILLSGDIPYDLPPSAQVSDLLALVKSKNFTNKDFESGVWASVTTQAKEFVMRMLRGEPEKRASAEELLKDPWLASASDAPLKEEDSKATLRKLAENHKETKLQHAVVTYLAHHADLDEERGRLTKHFESLDRNGDHVLTRVELRDGFKYSGITMTEAEIDSLFERLDSNNSGSINYTEYLAGTLEMDLLTNEKNLQMAFHFFDKDGNGRLDSAEIKRVLKKCYISDKYIADLIDDADANKDETISYDEFKLMMKKVSLRH